MKPLSTENIEALSVEEMMQVLHDLRTHQLELEMQNEELRRMQAELNSSKLRYFDLYDMAPVGYCTISEDGLILETNLTAATLLGLARSALLKQPLTRYIFPDDQDIYYLHCKQLFDTGKPQTCELRMLKMDGTAFWTQLATIAAQDADAAPVCRIAITDITDRKQEEDMLREQEIKYRRLFEHIQDVYFETTLAGVIREVSPSVLDVSGFSREEMIGKSVTDLYVNSADRHPYLETLLKNGKLTNYETQFIYKDGTHHWVSIISTLSYQSDGTPYGIIESIRDITGRKQKEMELQIKDSAIRTSIYGIAFVNLDGTIVYANLTFIDMWGYVTEKDVTDRTLKEFFITDSPDFNIVDDLLKKGKEGTEMTAVRNDRSLFAAQVSAGLIRSIAGNPLCMNVSVVDISVRKEMEDIMIRQEKLSSLGLLSAGLAHELRNPLAVISSCAQFSLENLSTDRLVTENFQVIYRNSQKASNLINDLLAFSRPSTLKQKLLNLNDIFLKMTDMAKLEMTASRIVFENQLAPDLPLVFGDEEKLGQVFLNIMINAIQAVGGKGTIIMKTAFHPNRRQVEAAVIDNGPGIPEEYRKRIFDPFFTTKDGGTGLGLSISFSIVQLHNGSIVAEPNTGGGTRISVMLPATFQPADGKETNHAD
jgi:PAS domain S-box-containing protein